MNNTNRRSRDQEGITGHPTFCPRCGKDLDMLIVVQGGRIYRCFACGALNAGASKPRKCGRCRVAARMDFVRTLSRYEAIPGQMCQVCQEERARFDSVVGAGGVLLTCGNCLSEGVLQPEHELAKAIRKETPAPQPIGLALDWRSCPNCGPAFTLALIACPGALPPSPQDRRGAP